MESMAPAHPTVLKTCTLVTADGVAIDTLHLPGPDDLAIVVAHGFTQSWQAPGVWKVTRRLNRAAGVVVFDFRGHGRCGGRGLRTGARLPARGDGRLLDGRVGGAASRGADRRGGCRGIGERPRMVVLPRHLADAAAAPCGGAPDRPAGHPGAARSGPAADRARRP